MWTFAGGREREWAPREPAAKDVRSPPNETHRRSLVLLSAHGVDHMSDERGFPRQRGSLAAVIRDGFRTVRRGLREAERGIRRLRKSRSRGANRVETPDAYRRGFTKPADETLAPRVLIIAETSIPQCTKYRVVQKQEAFRRLGIDCIWLSWTDAVACHEALQTHSHVIFYRVPASGAVLDLINEAKRLKLPHWWETDDLIFDADVLQRSRALARLDRARFAQLLDGAELYRRAMLACDAAIASTPGLAEAMRKGGMTDIRVVENGLDEQTLAIAAAACVRRRQSNDDGVVRIVYGSGTSTHDVDFEQAAPAIVMILERFPHVGLRLIGPVAVPPVLERFRTRIDHRPMTDYETYLGLLAECDISIAPLEDFVFNEAKSNIKYLEASAVGLPSVCSPRSAFAAVIRHEENGFLCSDEEGWKAALTRLVTDPAERRRVAAAARATVLHDYDPSRLAARQLAPLVVDRRRTGQLRVLSMNIFYAPRSFGGATVLAENVNRILKEQEGVDVHVFTAVAENVAKPYCLHRYESDGINVFGMGLPELIHETQAGFDNPDTVACFSAVLDAVQPDIVHVHCVQGLGVRAVELCRRRGIPYAITLHDAWWICGRQFMIDRAGSFCDQTTIDQRVCASCVDNNRWHLDRMRQARAVLEGADLLMAPSRYFADLHAANGFPGVRVNKNGIASPTRRGRTRRAGPVRVGYVGGNTPIKGFHLVQTAFRELRDLPATLVLVDNTLNLGFSSFGPEATRGLENVEVVPAYTRQSIDAFFADIDILLFPTQCKESFGLTVREAIIRDVWVIATDAGGVVEDIKPGKNGTIIPFRDDGTALVEAVVDAVERLGRTRPGDPVVFDDSGIRTCEEQAGELLRLLRGCVQTIQGEAA
jgi:glycosyltransferase involved in cell wall biosynthesis